MMGGFQIWTQNSNRTTFDPFFEKNSEIDKLLCYSIFEFCFAKNKTEISNVKRFEFWGQIWNPPLILHISVL